MRSDVWPLEDLRGATVSVDFDRLVLDGIAAAAGVPAVVVAVGDDPADDVSSALAALPVVSVAVGAGGASWDVVIEDPEPAVAGVRDSPMAAVVAAQTLRRGDRLDSADALLLESLAYAALQAGPEHARWLVRRGRRVRRDLHEPRIEVTDDGASTTITLDRPRLRNLLDAAMRDELVDVLKALHAGADGRRVVLTGAGGNFCAGGDPAEFGTVPDPASAHLIRSRANVAPWLAAVADRVTARVDGACVGAGVELAAFCGKVTATDRARFRLPELSMGLIPGAGGTVSLPARIGRQRTLGWLLTNVELDAATALRWGLVDAIV